MRVKAFFLQLSFIFCMASSVLSGRADAASFTESFESLTASVSASSSFSFWQGGVEFTVTISGGDGATFDLGTDFAHGSGKYLDVISNANSGATEYISIQRRDGLPWIFKSINAYNFSSTDWLTLRYYLVVGGYSGYMSREGLGYPNSGSVAGWPGGSGVTVTGITLESTDFQMVFDDLVGAIGPTASIAVSDTALSVGETSSVTFTFSEAVTGFTNDDLTIANGTLSAVSSSNGGITWTATLTPTSSITDTTNVITLDMGGVADTAGNAGIGTTNSSNYAIDTARPTATIVVSDNALRVGETSSVTFTFSEAVTGFTNADLTIANGTLSSLSSSDGGVTWTATLTPTSSITNTTNVITLDLTGVTDTAGNAGIGTTDSNNYAVDTVAPTVTSVNSSTANGTYKVGDTLSVQVNFSETVTVTGTPQLTLETGSTDQTVSYASGSGTSALTFTYTVQAGDSTADLDYVGTSALALNGGTITDSSGNTATLTLASPGVANSLGNNKALVIDGVAPTVTSVNSSTANGTYRVGDTLSVQVNFSETVTVTGTPQLTLETGSTDQTVNYASGSGTSALTFTYTVQAGDSTADLDYVGTSSLTLNSGTIRDSAGNTATLTLASPGAANSLGNNKALVIDGVLPAVTGLSPSSGSTAGATSVVLTGTGFTGATAVSFGGTPATGFFVNSATQITATAPAGAAGSVNVTVTTANGLSATGASNAYSYVTVPGAPTIGTATAGDTQASIAFTAPASNGGAAITGYTVTASPGGATGTGSSSPVIVTGLTNGTAYTFTVTATNSIGTGQASAASNSVTPAAGQTITFTNPGSQNFGTTPTLSASADSSLVVSFTSSTTGVCTITSGGTLTFITAGSCTINADQAGNGSFSAAPQVSQTFTVSPIAPGAPTIGVATAGDTQATVAFTAPAITGGTSITNYTVTVSPPDVAPVNGSSSPITVLGLTNGQAYTFTVTATNSAGAGQASAASNSITPVAGQTITFANPGTQNFGTTPTLSATASSTLAVTFTSTTTGVCTITSGGALTFVTAGSCTINADQAGNGSFSAAPTVTQSFSVSANVPGAPTIGTATAGNLQATVTFTPPTNTGGAAITSYTVTSSPGGITTTGSSSPITVTGLTNGSAYTFTVTATNSAGTSIASAASNSITPAATATPATEFTTHLVEISEVIGNDANRNLKSNLTANRNMVVNARDRFIEMRLDNLMSAAPVPLDVDGTFDTTRTTISSKGTFFGQADLNGGARRLVFGDFDIQHDSETGSSTATLNGKIAWEQSASDKTMLGYFIGGELARSNVAGTFEGNQNRMGLNAGTYVVEEFADNVYLDGFFSLGAGRNNLTMSNGVLDLDSDYTTRTATMGAALSGVIEQQGYDILPELSLSFGRTWIGDVGFTGAAHSLVDNTLSLDAGTVTLANILFRPEFRVPMDGLSGAQSLQVFSFAPRLSCEQVKTNVTEENCGAGAELGFSGSSVDGLSSVSAKIMADRMGDRTTSAVQLNLQHRF